MKEKKLIVRAEILGPRTWQATADTLEFVAGRLNLVARKLNLIAPSLNLIAPKLKFNRDLISV